MIIIISENNTLILPATLCTGEGNQGLYIINAHFTAGNPWLLLSGTALAPTPAQLILRQKHRNATKQQGKEHTEPLPATVWQ